MTPYTRLKEVIKEMSDDVLFHLLLSKDEITTIKVALLDSAFIEATINHNEDLAIEILKLVTKLSLQSDFMEV